jgi:hypothetical protein
VNALRPPLVYFGGKQTLAPRIAELLPDHLHYVEPYCGSLAVLLAKRPSRMETVNDLNQELVTFWRVLRERLADLEVVCSLTPHSRAEYEAVQLAEPTPRPTPSGPPAGSGSCSPKAAARRWAARPAGAASSPAPAPSFRCRATSRRTGDGCRPVRSD